jgi:hypothetical protein
VHQQDFPTLVHAELRRIHEVLFPAVDGFCPMSTGVRPTVEEDVLDELDLIRLAVKYMLFDVEALRRGLRRG